MTDGEKAAVSRMARKTPKGVILTILVAVGVIDSGVASAADVAVLDILRQPEHFAGQVVTIHGTMSPPTPVATLGRVLFEVRDGAALITVLAPMSACLPSSMITVEGRFQRFMQVDRQPTQNIIEAFSVVCR